MKRKEDPQREAARAERDKAGMELEILCNGVGAMFSGAYHRDYEGLKEVIVFVNGPLAQALKRVGAAEEAYRPYWRHVRRVIHTRRPKKNPAKKTAA